MTGKSRGQSVTGANLGTPYLIIDTGGIGRGIGGRSLVLAFLSPWV